MDQRPPVPAAVDPAAPTAEVGPTFVVHTDRRGVHRWHAWLVAAHGAFTLAIVAWLVLVVLLLSDAMTWWLCAPIVLLLLLELGQVGYQSYVWGARAALSVPMEIAAGGFTMHSSRGRIDVPWPAVAYLGLRRRVGVSYLLITLRPELLSAVLVDGRPADPRGMLKRHLLLLGSKGIHEDLGQVVAAIAALTAGRVQIR